MSHELFYTSAPRGLRPGSNGYCTVSATRGLPGLLGQQLERLSDYRPLFDSSSVAGTQNPIGLSHLRVNVAGKTYSVLSRICPAGVDHTKRGIFFAHHVALETTELPPAGPAWLLGQRGFLEPRWDGEVRELPAGRQPKMGTSMPGVCHAWKQATGDAGWAGVLVESFVETPNRPVYILYPLSLDPLPMLEEALALLPADQRWRVTFATLCLSVPQDVGCTWRCLPLEASDVRKARATPGALVLDLGSRLGHAEGGPLVAGARTGKVPVVRPSPVAPATPGLPAPAALQPPAAPSSIAWKEPVGPAQSPMVRPEAEPAPILPANSWMVADESASSSAAAETPPAPAQPTARPRRIRAEQPTTSGFEWFKPYLLGGLVGMLMTGLASAATMYAMKKDAEKNLDTALAQQLAEHHEIETKLTTENNRLQGERLQGDKTNLEDALAKAKIQIDALEKEKVKYPEKEAAAVKKAVQEAVDKTVAAAIQQVRDGAPKKTGPPSDNNIDNTISKAMEKCVTELKDAVAAAPDKKPSEKPPVPDQKAEVERLTKEVERLTKGVEADKKKAEKVLKAHEEVLSRVNAALFSQKSAQGKSLKDHVSSLEKVGEDGTDRWKSEFNKWLHDWMDAELQACFHRRGIALPDLIKMSNDLDYLGMLIDKKDALSHKHFEETHKLVKDFCEERKKDPTSALEAHRIMEFTNRLKDLRKQRKKSNK